MNECIRVVCVIVLVSLGSYASIHPTEPDVTYRVVDGVELKRQSTNPFGIMLTGPMALPLRMAVAKTLGAVSFRPEAVFLDRWDGTCPPCDAAISAGLQLILTVRANGGPRLPTAPPAHLHAYQTALAAVLDRYRPAVLVVENEENSALFYSGTPEEYGVQVQAACDVAHHKHIPCTNGGLVSTLVALLVYDYYLSTGQLSAARDFASRAFTAEQQQQLGSAQAQEQIRKGKALLAAYRAAGVDFVNFHWYIADPGALKEAVTYLRAQLGRPVITNEVGQFTDDPTETWSKMNTIVELGLPMAVWFAQDGPQARGLVNPNGSLRPTGEAFRRFIAQTFGTKP